MNIPSGKSIATNINLSEINPNKMLNDLQNKSFNGYVSININGNKGFEEGLLIIKKGFINGSYYIFIKNEKEVYGNEAINLISNAFGSKVGIIDIISLTLEQVDLLLTFNEKIKVNVDKFVLATNYDNNKIQKYFVDNEETSKYDLFKKIGLNSLRI